MRKRFVIWITLITLSLMSSCSASDSQDNEAENIFDGDIILADSLEEDEYIASETYEYSDYLEPVSSTCFESVGYCDEEEVLVVKFLESGSIYIYYEVPYYVYEDLIYANSIGGYYNENVKGQYHYKRIE
ncbi:MAG: KTSC domain-containing protein [Sphaerochaetaceae bacterium]|jgi:hypothetical protein|nr:KTSC domain-containing protein [Sphaerochaetaceae bacterium]MDD3289885.1 KTSC domain-containing protein [Eubacteriales bacterium]